MTVAGVGDGPAWRMAQTRRGFFKSRWHGEVPLASLFWSEMLVWSSLLNLAMLGASIIVLEGGLPLWVSILVFAAPIPWNLFLVGAIFREADRRGGNWSVAAKIGATLWLLVACLL